MAGKPTYEELEQRVKELKKAEVERKRAEESGRKSECYFRSLLNNIQEDILVIGPDYRITDINDTSLVTSRTKRKDVIGRHCFEISHGYNEPCSKREEECKLHEVVETGEPRKCVHKHLCADGSKAWTVILLSP